VKKRFSIFFLLVLSLPTIYKVGFFAFYQLNKDYIAENYCVNKDRPITLCYGSCFLDKGLALTDQIPNPDSLISTLKFEILEFLVDEVAVPTCCAKTVFTFSFQATPSTTDGVYNSVFHPPLA